MERPMRNVDMAKQPNLLGRWMAGGQQTQKRPSIFNIGRLFSGIPPESSIDSWERKELVEKLAKQLNESKIDNDGSPRTFTLTESELRLLLDLGENVNCENRKDDGEDCPSPLEDLSGSEASDLFDDYDFTSADDLTGDEVQAIMIALAAQRENNDSDDGDIIPVPTTLKNDGKSMLTPPPTLKSAARQVSIQTMPSTTGPQFLVTVGDGDGKLELPPPPTPSLEAKPSVISNRQYSIQSTARPDQLSTTARQVSVQALPRSGGSNTNDAQQFVICLPGSAISVPTTNNDIKDEDESNGKEETDKPPALAIRQVSVQPFARKRTERIVNIQNAPSSNTTPKQQKQRRQLPKRDPGFHRVGIRVNGKNMESFQVGGLMV